MADPDTEPHIITLKAQRVCGGCASWILPGDAWDTAKDRCVDCPGDAEEGA